MNIKIEEFLNSKAFGVVGASTNREKYGNKVLRSYLQNHKTVYPVNPNEQNIENITCVHKIAELPNTVTSISVITPPPITEKVVQEAHEKGIKNIWMQPGAESLKAIQFCEEHHMNVIAGGPCILVTLGFVEDKV